MNLALRHPLLGLCALLTLAPLTSSCSNQDCAPPTPSPGGVGNSYAGWQDIRITPEGVEFSVAENEEDQTAVFTVSNEGNADLVLKSAGLESWSSPQWQFEGGSFPLELEPGESSQLEVTFLAGSLEDSYAALSVYSNDPQQERVSLSLVGRGHLSPPAASLTPYVLDFGYRYPGQGSSQTLTIGNTGVETITLGSASLEQSAPTNPSFEILTSSFAIEGTAIAPGESFPIDIRFIPTGSLTELAQFVIETDDPRRPSLRAQLRGNGNNAAGCTPPTVTLDTPVTPFALAMGAGNHLQLSAYVDDVEQPASGLLVELLLGDTLLEDEVSGAGGLVQFDIDLDSYSVDNVWDEFPQGVNTFRLRVTDACPRSSELRFVAAIGEDLPLDDGDGDGYSTTTGDCDDDNPSVYPGALELADGVDGDCNGTIDNGTNAWDTDCDGYCLSPPCLGQGPEVQDADTCTGLAQDSDVLADCDDRTADSNHDGISDGAERSPALTEVPDYEDQNCNGLVDEGTNYADDDGDGLSELDGDCDDASDETRPGALELCDEQDNNCDGSVDEDCIETLLPPRLVGDILTDLYEVPFGASVEAQAIVLSDDESLTWSWESDIGGITSETDQPSIVWQAPQATPQNLELQGTFANLHVTVTDSRGRSSSAFGVIRLASDADGPSYSSVGGDLCGCASSGRSSNQATSFWLLFFAACVLRLRWRDEPRRME
jgi:hypothetical protein